MSEIQSIATNNYILHNIDAKKLYVQEPLFTANSGDAVYVGWRPDETVLWSGNTSHITAGQTWTASLNEPVSNFEKIGILLSHSYGWGIAAAPGNQLEMRETYINSGVAYWNYLDDLKPSIMTGGGNAPQYDAGLAYASGTNFTCVGYGRYQVTTAGNLSTTVANNRGVTILRVVGINRKENA